MENNENKQFVHREPVYTLVPVVLHDKDPEGLAKQIALERIKRNQPTAVAHYTSLWIPRKGIAGEFGHGFHRFTAFVEFMIEEKP